jgi:uncharacterized cupin superfamily protein
MPAIPDISGYVRDANAVALPAPTPRLPATSGAPAEASIVLHRDEHLEIGIWECSPGTFPGARIGYNELMVFVAGSGTLTTEAGDARPIEAGVVYPSLDGWKAEWNVTETVRKVYVIWGDTR